MSIQFKPRKEVDVILRDGAPVSDNGSIKKKDNGIVVFQPPRYCDMTREDLLAVLKAMDDFQKANPI